MAEVRTSPFGNLGLFATKSFSTGDRIFEENPVVTLAPLSEDESKALMVDLVGDKKQSPKKKVSSKSPALWNVIDVPSSVPAPFKGTFRGMVQAGLCWMKRQPKGKKEEDFLKLFYPAKDTSSSLEQSIRQVSEQALEYLKSSQKKDSEFQNWETLETVLLIWACNSFQGGRVYSQLSRVNHDCNPNAVIQHTEETQRLVAATDIAKGQEITISYLGLVLYAETSVRNEWLKKSKFFECHCARCSASSDDKAARIPCPTCHPRQGPQQSLDEEVQYDDNQAVQYTTLARSCSKCKSKPEEEDSKLRKIMASVTRKIVSYLETSETSNKSEDDDDDDDDDGEILEEHASLSSTIMGDKHWTTNLLMLMHLDRRLTSMSQTMLTNQELPEMDDVAEIIDSLERICRFVEFVDLKLDGGHILGDVIIGVARTLVSLCDVKSQKYGAEWLDKISDYVQKFESEGRQKVVATLRVAWKKHDRDGNDDNGDDEAKMKKKAKTS